MLILKQLPIKYSDIQKLADVRLNIFNDKVLALSERLYAGEITIGAWEESCKAEIRSLWTSLGAMAKGGWDNMTFSDWGRIGNDLKKEYRYLHVFAQYIADNRDAVSLAYITNRIRMYGNTALRILGEFAVDVDILALIRLNFGGVPKNSGSKCMQNCHCIIIFTELSRNERLKTKNIQAEWQLRPAEHCTDCIAKDKKTFNFTCPITQKIPPSIGGY